jgi:hypothetical protein
VGVALEDEVVSAAEDDPCRSCAREASAASASFKSASRHVAWRSNHTRGCWDNVPFDEPRELDPNDWDVMSLRTRTKCLVPAHYSISGTRLTEHLFPLSFIGSWKALMIRQMVF